MTSPACQDTAPTAGSVWQTRPGKFTVRTRRVGLTEIADRPPRPRCQCPRQCPGPPRLGPTPGGCHLSRRSRGLGARAHWGRRSHRKGPGPGAGPAAAGPSRLGPGGSERPSHLQWAAAGQPRTQGDPMSESRTVWAPAAPSENRPLIIPN